MMIKWIAARLHTGSRTRVNHLLYWQRKKVK